MRRDVKLAAYIMCIYIVRVIGEFSLNPLYRLRDIPVTLSDIFSSCFPIRIKFDVNKHKTLHKNTRLLCQV